MLSNLNLSASQQAISVGIEGCKRCKYNNQNEMVCLECDKDENYFQKENSCHKTTELKNSIVLGNVVLKCSVLIDNCLDCKVDGSVVVCEKCEENFDLTKDKSCSQSIENCTKVTKGKCEICKDGYFLESSKCSKCIDNCTSCDNKDTCSKCAIQFYFESIDQRKCSRCEVDHCYSCGEVVSVCRKCYKHYNLSVDRKKCAKCTISNCSSCSGDQCGKCFDGYYLDSELKCKKCAESNCKKCSADQCIQCQKNFILDKKFKCVNAYEIENCLGYSEINDCVLCKVGYYIELDGRCVACSQEVPNCASCETNKVCTSCESNYYLTNTNKCLPCDSASSCQEVVNSLAQKALNSLQHSLDIANLDSIAVRTTIDIQVQNIILQQANIFTQQASSDVQNPVEVNSNSVKVLESLEIMIDQIQNKSGEKKTEYSTPILNISIQQVFISQTTKVFSFSTEEGFQEEDSSNSLTSTKIIKQDHKNCPFLLKGNDKKSKKYPFLQMKKQKVKVFGRLLEAEAPLRVKFEFPVEDASALVNPVCLTYKESTKELVKCQDVTQADIVDNNKVVCSCDDSATMYEDVDFLFRDKKEQEGNTLSTGVIVAIVIVSLIVVGLVIIIVLTNLKKQENKKNNMHMISEKEQIQVQGDPKILNSDGKLFGSGKIMDSKNMYDIKGGHRDTNVDEIDTKL